MFSYLKLSFPLSFCQVMGGEMRVKMTLTKIMFLTLMTSALKMLTSVKQTFADFKWFPLIQREHLRMIPTGLFVTKAKNWFRPSTVILDLQSVSKHVGSSLSTVIYRWNQSAFGVSNFSPKGSALASGVQNPLNYIGALADFNK